MTRGWKGKRDYWLDHYGQLQPGQRREASAQTITPSDYMAVPIPLNAPTPLASPCLIWRWGLGGRGYGMIGGRYVHVVAYEQSRDCKVSRESGEQIDHLCHRSFCVQPAHLYLGDAQTNAEDRKGPSVGDGQLRNLGPGRRPVRQGDDQILLGSPQDQRAVPRLRQSTGVPPRLRHDQIRGDAHICSNCGEVSESLDVVSHKTPCWELWPESPPCRCQPCCCRTCLKVMLGPAQRAFGGNGWRVAGPLFGEHDTRRLF